jgi:rubrerythrin
MNYIASEYLRIATNKKQAIYNLLELIDELTDNLDNTINEIKSNDNYIINSYIENSEITEQAKIDKEEFLDELKEDSEKVISDIKRSISIYVELENLCPDCYGELKCEKIDEIADEFYIIPIHKFYCEECGYENEFY